MELDTLLMFLSDDSLHTLPGKGHDWATSPVSNILRGSLETRMVITNSSLVEWAKRQGG